MCIPLFSRLKVYAGTLDPELDERGWVDVLSYLNLSHSGVQLRTFFFEVKCDCSSHYSYQHCCYHYSRFHYLLVGWQQGRVMNIVLDASTWLGRSHVLRNVGGSCFGAHQVHCTWTWRRWGPKLRNVKKSNNCAQVIRFEESKSKSKSGSKVEGRAFKWSVGAYGIKIIKLYHRGDLFIGLLRSHKEFHVYFPFICSWHSHGDEPIYVSFHLFWSVCVQEF